MNRRCAALALTGILAICSGVAHAQAPLLSGFGGPVGFGTDVVMPEDDSSSPPVSLSTAFPSGLEFFGTRYNELFVNTNGNVSFSMPLASFTPTPFPIAAQPIIAPWWADADTRGVAPVNENRVYWHVEPGRFIATWFRVGYFDSHVDLINSVQLILTDQSAMGSPGDFDVEFRYNQLAWTTGDASDGIGGLGGTPAQAGFDAGNSIDFFVLPGSLTPFVLDLSMISNVGEAGVWRFQIRSGGVTVCGDTFRDPGEACDDGNTVPGDGCSARCEIEFPEGSACFDDLQCLSSFCVAGLCCDRLCDGECEACSPAGLCEIAPAGVVCRPGFDLCDAEELCDGAAVFCGPDLPVADGTGCGNGIACDGDELCVGGVCDPGVPPVCDDSDVCTTDTCAEPGGCMSTPIMGCGVDAGVDAGPMDAGVDAGPMDAGVDAGLSDAGPGDAGVDAGLGDAGVDAGLPDPPDAGSIDAGLLDSGSSDGGAADAGRMPMDGEVAEVDNGTPAGSGLSCRVSQREDGSLPIGLLALAALVWARRKSYRR